MSRFSKSPWIIHYDASSCNGCDIETLACLTPLFDVERLGVVNTGNPKHADIFLVTGAVNAQSCDVIRNIYHQLPEPKVVVAVGTCASTGGIFRECYNIAGGVDAVIPVDVYVPGCAARPEAIIDGVVRALQALEDKQRAMCQRAGSLDKVLYLRADKSDAAEILALQKTAYQTETELYGDESLPGLDQTLEELQHEFGESTNGAVTSKPVDGSTVVNHSTACTFLKAVVNAKIIGSVRGHMDGNTVLLSREFVHPYFQKRGVGTRMLGVMTELFPQAERFEIYTGSKSERSLNHLRKAGYTEFKLEPLTPAITLVHMYKNRA